jgi:hypothetical protein
MRVRRRSGACMSDPINPLLTAADEIALRDAVAAVGGFHRAIDLLFDEALRLQNTGGGENDIRTLVAISDRIETLARYAGS